MTSINELSHLLNVVRLTAQQSERTQKPISAPAATTKKSDRLSRPALKRLIRKRLLELNKAEEPPSFEQTLTSFVEAVLVWEFGEDILQSKNTTRTIKETVRQCQENTTLTQQINKFFTELAAEKNMR